MSVRITKFGVELIGKPFPAVVVDPFANAIFPLISKGNWRGSFSVETSWQTAISRSPITGAEEREGLVTRPTRATKALISGFSREETTRMLVNAFGMASTRFPAALYSDFTIAENASTTLVECDTRWKRFFPGQRVAVLPANYSLSTGLLSAQFAEIAVVQMSGISFVTPLTTASVVGDIILPLFDAHISLSSNLSAHTDSVAEWQQECLEYSGQSTLPGFSDEDVTYLGLSYFEGYPIFDFLPNWRENVQVRVGREASFDSQGTSGVFVSEAPVPHLVFSGTFEDYSRRSAWHSARFFDSRKGRLRPFWIENPLTLFTLSSVPNLAQIRVVAAASSLQFESLLTHLSVHYLDGTRKLYKIDTIADVSNTLEFTLFGTLDSDDIDYITSAHLCRFNSDSLLQEWETDYVCSYEFDCKSLIDEAAYAMSYL